MHNIVDLKSFPVIVMCSNGCPNSIKDLFPKHVFDWIGLIQEYCWHVHCYYSERQGNFCHFMQEFNSPQVIWEYLCDCFTIMVLKWCEAMLHRSVIQTKTVTAGLCTFTMLVSKPIDHISFRQWVRTESFAWHIWNYMFHESPTAASQARRRRGDTQIGLHHKHHCPT